MFESGSEFATQPSTRKNSSDSNPAAGLDDLRKELEQSNSNAASTANASVNSGCIPLRFLQGIFAATVPSQQACVIMDWIVLNYERYAGMFVW